ncbi:MAG TPA: L-histidine N(alpha)-methyltransferase [Terriglobales bacterium]|nr:L-histidine N(alpha)-methyltransferase [Terriglobales bacterium]
MSAPLFIASASPIAADVYEGLSAKPKWLSPKLFYDAEGSALFEQITDLPEYYLTRTERSILEANAADIIAAAGPNLSLIELGAGTASKTRILIGAALKRQSRCSFYPIDVSKSALDEAVHHLNGDFPGLSVSPIVADYSGGLGRLSSVTGRKLLLYLGSSIGNFEPMQAGAMLRTIRTSLRPGDALLLGTDLVKSPKLLIPAYDDAQGVTAAFNKNILARINRELAADFDLSTFKHVAVWNHEASRIEMHLESTRPQVVHVRALGMRVHFNKGETIHTENSYKFTQGVVDSILDLAGFKREQTWTDPKHWFALHLARVTEPR